MTEISFASSENAWLRYDGFLRTLIEKTNSKRIAEIGGGANPSLDQSYIEAGGLAYHLIDVSSAELDKADDHYHKVVADITRPRVRLPGDQDLVFSKMLAEHISDAQAMHRNVFEMLKPGGHAFHFFPTLYALPFVLNRVMPEAFTQRVLSWFQPARRQGGPQGKFPAHYHWCRGPSRGQIAAFEGLGYEVVKYIGYFGHDGYYRRIKPLLRLHQGITRCLIRYPVPVVTSFAYLVLRKPI